mgnify:CR=1 FL=1
MTSQSSVGAFNIIGMAADPNNDGWSNVLVFVLATSPSAYSEDTLPTQSADVTCLTTVFARSADAAYLNPTVEYDADMTNWNTAVHGENGVVIEVEDDAFGTDPSGVGIDKVNV